MTDLPQAVLPIWPQRIVEPGNIGDTDNYQPQMAGPQRLDAQ